MDSLGYVVQAIIHFLSKIENLKKGHLLLHHLTVSYPADNNRPTTHCIFILPFSMQCSAGIKGKLSCSAGAFAYHRKLLAEVGTLSCQEADVPIELNA